MSVYFIYGWFCNDATSEQFIVVYSHWRLVIGWWFYFQKHKMTKLMSKMLFTFRSDIPLRDSFQERDHCMRPEILRLCTLLIMTSTCCACEALPFKHCWANSTLWKWAALLRALQQRDRKVRAFHTRQRPVHCLQPSQSEEVCRIRFHSDTIRMNYCGRKCLKLYIMTGQVKSTTQTYLVASSDKLFVVWSGEQRVQCHHLQNNTWRAD